MIQIYYEQQTYAMYHKGFGNKYTLVILSYWYHEKLHALSFHVRLT